MKLAPASEGAVTRDSYMQPASDEFTVMASVEDADTDGGKDGNAAHDPHIARYDCSQAIRSRPGAYRHRRVLARAARGPRPYCEAEGGPACTRKGRTTEA